MAKQSTQRNSLAGIFSSTLIVLSMTLLVGKYSLQTTFGRWAFALQIVALAMINLLHYRSLK